jgi:hypothetical protein
MTELDPIQPASDRLALLYHLSQAFNSSLDLDEVLNRVMLRAAQEDFQKAEDLLKEAIQIYQDLEAPHYLQEAQSIYDRLKGRKQNG